MVLLAVGDHVWIPSPTDAGISTPIGAKVIDVSNPNGIQVVDDEERRFFLTPDIHIRLMHPRSILGLEDLAELEDIHEASILRNLFVRYTQDRIYTFCGDCLIALNPLCPLGIYSQSFINCYQKRRLGELEPHVFSIAEAAVSGLNAGHRDHSIMISGESGAGKTETYNFIIKYVTNNAMQQTKDQIIASDIVIGVFGNARTVDNTNSSRFSKYTQIYFNQKGHIQGAEITQYFLEKSRATNYRSDDSNFHIFYILFNELNKEQKKILHLTNIEDYFILNQGTKMSDINSFPNITECLRQIQFDENLIDEVYRLLSALLHLGNVDFQTRTSKDLETTDVMDPEHIAIISDLLMLSPDNLKTLLTSSSIILRSQRVFRNLTARQSLDLRDNLIRNLYSGLFQFIHNYINTILQPKSDSEALRSLGVLDISGFESLKQNRFEQFCINYSNEVLEQFFIRHLCKLEQLEYKSQNVTFEPCKFMDNVMTLDLLASGPNSIISLVNEKTVFPQSTDQSMLLKLHHHHSHSGIYIQPKCDLSRCFAIKHYAATVLYNTRGFIEKNKDHVPHEVISFLSTSKSRLIRSLVAESDVFNSKESVLHNLKRSLDSLMTKLDITSCHFIRCIKPNEKQTADVFDRTYVLKQIRYTGMLDLVVMKNSGYPIRKSYVEFVDNFRGLLPGLRPARYENCVEATSRILTVILGADADFQLGRTKVFMKRGDYIFMESEGQKMKDFFATSIQKHLRGWIQKIKYERQRLATVVIQKYWKGYMQRRNYQRILNGIIRLQAILRSHQLVSWFTAMSQYTTQLQALCRGSLTRNLLKQKKLRVASENISADHYAANNNEENTDFKFEKYVLTNFQRENSSHLKGVIPSSLLHHTKLIDTICATVLWKQILRFAGDLPELQTETEKEQQNILDIMYHVLNSVELLENQDYCKEAYPNYFERSFSVIERVQIVVLHGILRSELRDEIYSQILKQINRNPTSTTTKYWILLAVVSSSFPPSNAFLPYFNNFIEQFISSNPAYPTIRNHIENCYSKGCRIQPTSILEFEAIQSFKQILLPITFSNGSINQFIVDSFTTTSELCGQVRKMLDLKEKFGFSLYLSLNGTASSLGAGSDFVFDAISVCEREAFKKGHEHINTPWRLFYRKEIFSPWHCSMSDNLASDLIYEQIISGLHYGEYECSDETEIILLAAQQYFILNDGAEIDFHRLENKLKFILPVPIIKDERFQPELWIQKIMNIYRKTYMHTNVSPLDVKAQVIDFARVKWAIAFSRLFQAQQLNGLRIPDIQVVIAINSEGVNVVNNKNEVLCSIGYDEIENVVVNEYLNSNLLNIQTVGDTEFNAHTRDAMNIKELIIFFINGIKKRSKYMIAQESVDNKRFITCDVGDVLYMDNPKERKNGVIVQCENTKTNERGMIPLNKVIVLATLKSPSCKLIQHYQKHNQFNSKTSEQIDNEQTIIFYDNSTLKLVRLAKPHTLQDFAHTYFTSKSDVMFRYGSIPLTEPLLKASRDNESLRNKAVKMYINVMRFMGDLPWSQSTYALTDAIFTEPLANTELRDELYSQVVKQLTENPDPNSEQRGWQLMWMALGLFPPSKPLYKELEKILRSKQNPKRRECLDRLSKIMSVMQPRKRPPHYVEVDSIIANKTEIFHKFHLPDGSSEIIKMESSDLCCHLCQRIANTKMMNPEGSAIFIRINDKVISLPGKEYIFDYLRQITEGVKPSDPRTLNYKLLLMRKIWIDVNPGIDPQGDVVLHFPQELPKYLRGYYNVKDKEVTRLAALIMRSKTNEASEIPIKHISNVLEEILPKDYVKKYNNTEWRKAISKECLKLPKMTSSDSKIAFLKELCKLPTFGSAFFEVKQTSDPSIPTKINLAINKQGVSVFNPETKEIIIQYPYNGIVNWTAGNTYFHMTTGNMIKGGRLLVETTLGYKIDDLLSSYVQIICESSNRKSHTA